MEWAVFSLMAVAGRTAPEVVAEINARFRLRPPLEAVKSYRITRKVRTIFTEEFRRVGIDSAKEGPDLSELRKELGLAGPPEAPAASE